jgi:hypothetical protein
VPAPTKLALLLLDSYKKLPSDFIDVRAIRCKVANKTPKEELR